MGAWVRSSLRWKHFLKIHGSESYTLDRCVGSSWFGKRTSFEFGALEGLGLTVLTLFSTGLQRSGILKVSTIAWRAVSPQICHLAVWRGGKSQKPQALNP